MFGVTAAKDDADRAYTGFLKKQDHTILHRDVQRKPMSKFDILMEVTKAAPSDTYIPSRVHLAYDAAPRVIKNLAQLKGIRERLATYSAMPSWMTYAYPDASMTWTTAGEWKRRVLNQIQYLLSLSKAFRTKDIYYIAWYVAEAMLSADMTQLKALMERVQKLLKRKKLKPTTMTADRFPNTTSLLKYMHGGLLVPGNISQRNCVLAGKHLVDASLSVAPSRDAQPLSTDATPLPYRHPIQNDVDKFKKFLDKKYKAFREQYTELDSEYKAYTKLSDTLQEKKNNIETARNAVDKSGDLRSKVGAELNRLTSFNERKYPQVKTIRMLHQTLRKIGRAHV